MLLLLVILLKLRTVSWMDVSKEVRVGVRREAVWRKRTPRRMVTSGRLETSGWLDASLALKITHV